MIPNFKVNIIKLGETETVHANTNATEKEFDRLCQHFHSLLLPEHREIFDKLISLSQALEDLEHSCMTPKGWQENVLEPFNWIDNKLVEVSGLVMLDWEAFTKLEEIHQDEKLTSPDITIEQTLSKIILSIPMPG